MVLISDKDNRLHSSTACIHEQSFIRENIARYLECVTRTIRDHCQILLRILSEFKRIYRLLFAL